VLRRSQLYVPGNNEKMIVKAAALDADSVILDLEDAVPPVQKAAARGIVMRLSKEVDWGRRELCIRINPLGSPEHSEDVSLVKRLDAVDAVVIPKAEGDCSLAGKKSGKPTIPIIETAKGLMNLQAVARSKGITAITYGAADYASSVGGSVDAYASNQAVKTLVVAAASTYGVDALDNVFFDLDDLEGFRSQALAARALGYTGKQVVHPSQIAVANQVFTPSKSDAEWAQKVIREFRRAGTRNRGAIRVEGRLVDAVHYRLARGVLDRSAILRG
jgi:citrate lyase subunit beta/citryl-CoA lyase